MSEPRPTPETDAVADTAWDGVSDDYSAYARMLSHARRLERERDEARREAELWRDSFKTGMSVQVKPPSRVFPWEREPVPPSKNSAGNPSGMEWEKFTPLELFT